MGLFVLFFGTKNATTVLPITPSGWGHVTRSYWPIFLIEKSLLMISRYIYRPTATDESFAPDGCDSFYVLCPVPNLRASINWNESGPKLQDRIIKALADTILPDLDKFISDPFYMTPEDFKNDYRSMYGLDFQLRLFSCSRRGFVFTIVIHISPIYILQRPARTQAQVYPAFCVQQKWWKVSLMKMKKTNHRHRQGLMRYNHALAW